MECAVLGAGLAGSAVGYYLSKSGCSVTLFDQSEKPSGASAVKSGLLHAFPGKWNRKSRCADEALFASISLIDLVEKKLGEQVSLQVPIHRTHPFSKPPKSLMIEQAGEEFLIHGGRIVFIDEYVQGLKACYPHRFVVKDCSNLHDFEGFDLVIVCLGKTLVDLFPHLGAEIVKGQAITVKELSKTTRFPELSFLHASPRKDGQTWIGSSYERARDETPNFQSAWEYFLPRLEKCGWKIQPSDVVELFSAFRVYRSFTPFPIVEKISSKLYIYGSLGSRGLLYHALFAKQLVNEIFLPSAGFFPAISVT